ncbi:hypothetical protein AYI69_g1560 [Smittium culicis]|uniref:Uncharacterized protein n=1 Tax=Smittium culicis TaxID=133412 RepID=A0A1R1YPV5_9FUNG|nr:hypothetical protein AYI69_g1560 [Smittium culicis]
MAVMCKEIIVEIEGSAVKVPIFVSDQTKTPVILGRPWDIKSRVLKDTRSDGSLWYTIRDENSGAARTFCVNDERDNIDLRMLNHMRKTEALKRLPSWYVILSTLRQMNKHKS